MIHSPTAFLLALTLLISACGSPTEEAQHDTLGVDSARMDARVRPSIYVPVKLNTDLSVLNATDRQLLPLFISVADIMDSLFWQEAWGRPIIPMASIQTSGSISRSSVRSIRSSFMASTLQGRRSKTPA